MEMEEETEKEADDVESGRKALRAGREIEAVARSVPDLTDPDPDLRETALSRYSQQLI